jgi:hypothetical protein
MNKMPDVDGVVSYGKDRGSGRNWLEPDMFTG